MKKLLLSCLMLGSLSVAHGKTMLSCFTDSGKKIEVQRIGNQYQYSFGYPNRPEITFRNTVSDVHKRGIHGQNCGGGGSCTYSLILKNGDYYYQAYHEAFRMSDEFDAGVIVRRGTGRNEKHITSVECNPNKPIHSELNWLD